MAQVTRMTPTAFNGPTSPTGAQVTRLATGATLLRSAAALGNPPVILRHTRGTQVVTARHLPPMPRATRWTAALPLVFALLAPPALSHPYALGV